MIICGNCGSRMAGYGNCLQCGAPNHEPQADEGVPVVPPQVIEVVEDDEEPVAARPRPLSRPQPARPQGDGCINAFVTWFMIALFSGVIIWGTMLRTSLPEAVSQEFRIKQGWVIVLQDEVTLEDARSLAPFKIVHGEEDVIEGETVFEGPFTMAPGRWYVVGGVVDVVLSAEEPFPVTLMKDPGAAGIIWGLWAMVMLLLVLLIAVNIPPG